LIYSLRINVTNVPLIVVDRVVLRGGAQYLKRGFESMNVLAKEDGMKLYTVRTVDN